MGHKAGNGEGSITAHAKGKWRLRWTAPPDPLTGEAKRRSEVVTGTKREAQARLREVLSEGSTSSDMTLRVLIERWREVRPHAPSTARNYDTAQRRIPEQLLATEVRRITAADLDRLYQALTQRDGIHATRQVHAVISGALTQACRWQILRENPARWATVPAPPKRQAQAPTVEELTALLEVARERDLMLAVWLRLSIVLGARRGEVLALRWTDIDLAQKIVTIAHAIDPVTGGLKGTKTGQVRRVAIDAVTADLLTVWRVAIDDRGDELGITVAPDAFVISDELDMTKPWRSDSATKRFGVLRRHAGVSIRLHDIRHAAASHLLAAGMDLKTVSQRLGHTRTSTTADIYGHVMPNVDRTSAEILGRIG